MRAQTLRVQYPGAITIRRRSALWRRFGNRFEEIVAVHVTQENILRLISPVHDPPWLEIKKRPRRDKHDTLRREILACVVWAKELGPVPYSVKRKKSFSDSAEEPKLIKSEQLKTPLKD